MDVVRNEIASLGGRVEVTSQSGHGTTFKVYLPLTLAVTQTVLVNAAGQTYALPSVMIEQVQELKPEALAKAYETTEVEWMGNHYPFTYLPRLFGNEEQVLPVQRYNSVILLRSGAQRAAVHVDELVGNREVVVKNIGPQLTRVPGISGATVLGDGRVVMIINPVLLAHRDTAPLVITKGEKLPTPEEKPATAPLIMVVDDSLTVRKITSRLLAREGYEVVTAKDGVDALQQLQEHTPDVMLVDIEMPRMDGFELTKNVRGDAAMAHIPIIMITSRTAEKHRSYAKELGVNAYLGKPYQEEELLGQIASLISAAATKH
jgi:chemosensory pili system protein ChpA (sensor histidine kinase/response regulator)